MAKKSAKSSKGKKGSTIKLNDERIVKIVGVLCLFFSLYLTIAFISYCFTWQSDQDKVLDLSTAILFNGEITVENWLGRLGAYTSHMLVYWGFGVSSVGVIFLLFRLGLDLISRVSLMKFFNLLMQMILLMSFTAVILEFIFRSSSFSWGGLMGYSIYSYLASFLGQIGLVLLMVLLIIASFIWIINPIIHLDRLRMSTDLGQFAVSKLDFLQSWGQAVDQTLKPRASKKKSKREPLFEEFEGANPKTEIKDDGSLKPNDTGIELNLPESLVSFKKAQAKAKSNPDLELELEEVVPEAQSDATETVSPKPVKKAGPDMDSEKLYVEEENKDDFEPYDPTKELSKYQFPGFDILEDYADQKVKINREELEENKNQIIKTLLNYNIKITKIRATIGPTVTLYEIVPAPGVKISSIKKLEDDIALSLAALGIRIIAPIPGKGTVGIEVPNKNKQIVSFKEVVTSDKFQNAKMDLPIVLGKTISNEVFVADLAKMPHLLIAGATGQGKSVGINTILMSLLYRKHPSQVKLVMIDPKKVELFPYNNLDRHFLGFLPNEDEMIVTDTKKVIKTLHSLTVEMDDRYDLLKKARARNIKEYNAKYVNRKISPKDGHRFLPFIVLVIDEFADLIMTAGKEIETPIARLAQLARAIGIHLIIATQRPSVKIITGMIKANFPARIAFRVTSQIDSRTILDAKGAEQLIGKGDMLLTVGSDMVRLQCAFVDTPEVEEAIEFISKQKGFVEPFHLPEVADESSEMGGSNLKWSDLDPMFEEAARLVVGNQHGSTSNIQRKLQLGYNRAGRIMDQMEALGIVGESNGSKPRQVLFVSEIELINYIDHLKSGKV
ncbi:MAG: DNA translocase FtsK [Saprospiraceae bacterium]|nr:DNA translocase FtsK [Bacteroidia bacterium]NNE15843.1 DNA translocase FtsK [Saprospiraceae bacterium]NNL92902.1 DNA translocase FtsK [Saprospiraceae bacterium]